MNPYLENPKFWPLVYKYLIIGTIKYLFR
ncbi:hypothetical protein [Trichodesmium erythraeum]|nr:hypothetical protein [Trichodesmium erythraeum GBRTRLIN201]